MLKNKLFVRIYTSMVFLVLVIMFFCYGVMQIVNHHRAQTFRESLTDGISWVIDETLSTHSSEEQLGWVSDASVVLGTTLQFVRQEDVSLTVREKERIANQQAVVRYNKDKGAQIFLGVKARPNFYLTANFEKIDERQIKALSVFVIDYLAMFPKQEEKYVKQIADRFTYPLEIKNLKDLQLDNEQIGRLRQDQSLIIYRDAKDWDAGGIMVISPIQSDPSKVVVFGGIPMYSVLSFQLGTSIVILALVLLSLGVYALIVPLQRKLEQVSGALNRMRAGDLNVRVEEQGTDEMATLAHSYNDMVEHIQRLIEAQKELMRAVSHELRTPVARIRFAVQMLEDEDDIDARHFQANLIDKDIEELNKLIDEIMTYAKLEQGMPSFEFEPIVLADVLEQVHNETLALQTGKQIELVPMNRDDVVDAEYRYLHRVVQNFVGNAVRYANEKVRISGGILPDGQAFVCVEDDGAGIPEEDRQRVFEAFARLDDSRTRASGGYGLGLSIVARIAYWFGGRVEVDESPELGGAKFMMTWVAKRENAVNVK